MDKKHKGDNMKYILLVLTLVFGMAHMALAQSLAVLDIAEVISQANASKAAEAELEKKRDEAQAKIKEIEAPLIEEKNALDARRAAMSEEQYASQQNELRKKIRQFRVEVQAMQEDLQQQALRTRQEVEQSIVEEVDKLAQERGYTIVLPKNILLYSADTTDISAEILQRLNARN